MGPLRRALTRLDRTGVEPVAWKPPPAPRETSVPTFDLDTVERWPLPGSTGPEDVAVDSEGRVVAGTDDGAIWRFDGPASVTRIADTGGRPLGIEVLADGRYLVCDADRGLLRVDDSGRVDVLTDTAAGSPLLLCNNAAVDSAGVVYFTDSSARFRLAEHRLDAIEHSGTGRLIRFDPATGDTDILLAGLQFGNGVGLAADESYLLVAETAGYAIRRVDLRGPTAGTATTWVDNLPGFPDNVASQTDGGIFWVALYSPRLPALDRLAPYPALRIVAANLPDRLAPQPILRGRVLGFDGDGTVVHDLRGDRDSYAPVTGVRESGGRLYLGSLTADAVACLPAPTPPV